MSELEYRNSMALAEEIRRLRSDYSERLKVMENENQMRKAEILQLQNLFAQQTVMRGSGPTA
jgi:hypothetical protein